MKEKQTLNQVRKPLPLIMKNMSILFFTLFGQPDNFNTIGAELNFG